MVSLSFTWAMMLEAMRGVLVGDGGWVIGLGGEAWWETKFSVEEDSGDTILTLEHCISL